jgi:hypothetical protein
MANGGSSATSKGPNESGRNHPETIWGWLSCLHIPWDGLAISKGPLWPPSSLFYLFIFIFFNGGIFGIQTLVHGAILESFAPKNSRAVHLSNFPSNKTAMANEVAKLKILEIWLGYIANF